jgi:hypothetical protein
VGKKVNPHPVNGGVEYPSRLKTRNDTQTRVETMTNYNNTTTNLGQET